MRFRRFYRKASYKKSSDVCTICGKSGGEHFSSDGISWCYPPARREESDDPIWQTHFSYDKVGNTDKLDDTNPNKTFKMKKGVYSGTQQDHRNGKLSTNRYGIRDSKYR